MYTQVNDLTKAHNNVKKKVYLHIFNQLVCAF